MTIRPNEHGAHPSFLELDRAFLGHTSPEVSAHASRCEACREYLESLPQLARAADFGAVRDAIDGRSRFSLAWFFPPMALAAAACALLLFVTHRAPPMGGTESTYVGAKGFRSVWIYVKRGSDTQLWDGKRPLVPRDRVRLKIDPGGYHHVQIYSTSDPRNSILLYEGALVPGQNLTLPDAWEIDDSSTAEQLLVVFGNAPVRPSWDEWRQGRAQPGVAILSFALPKAGRASTDAGPFSP